MADDEAKQDPAQEPEAPVDVPTDMSAEEPADEFAADNGQAEPVDGDQAGEPLTDEPVAEDQAEEGPGEAEPVFSWQASEFVHHHKSPIWYAVVVMIMIVLIAFAVWLHLWLEIAVFIAGAAAIIVYARKPPRTLTYELSSQGIKIEGKPYPFKDFRSFGVVEDEEWHNIDLEPAKRFSLRLVLLFDSSNFDEIVGHLERHLPREDREPTVVERITRFVRF